MGHRCDLLARVLSYLTVLLKFSIQPIQLLLNGFIQFVGAPFAFFLLLGNRLLQCGEPDRHSIGHPLNGLALVVGDIVHGVADAEQFLIGAFGPVLVFFPAFLVFSVHFCAEIALNFGNLVL